MAFDAKGRLWVTCTLEYPYPVEVGKPGRDYICILEDTDGDGRAEKVTRFAEGLNIPIGLYPYGDGVICYSIPNILVLARHQRRWEVRHERDSIWPLRSYARHTRHDQWTNARFRRLALC